jgi:hypothetical protein
MKLKLNSGLFSVIDPCGYWEFDGLREYNEDFADEGHEEDRYIVDTDSSLFLNTEAWLTVPNPDWRPGHYETDYTEFVGILSECWVETFNDRLCEVGIKAVVKHTGHYSPREYNLAHDQADFTFTITKAEVERLAALCLADERFRQHLIDLYSDRSGFWSFLTNSVEVFTENARGEHGEQEYERAIWQAVNFIMFPDEESSKSWNTRFRESAYDADFSDTLHFVEDTEEDAV